MYKLRNLFRLVIVFLTIIINGNAVAEVSLYGSIGLFELDNRTGRLAFSVGTYTNI
jgi:hypothetical protein